MLQTSLDKISFNPRQILCLHVTSQEQFETFCRETSRRFKSENINGVLAKHANLKTVRRKLFRHVTVVDWLAQNADISPEIASKIIDGFPISTRPRLSQNAENPRAFLGLAAAIAQKPDVIVYSTGGMDPLGVSLIHKYAAVHYPEGCLIHVLTRPIGNAPSCPNGAQCMLLQFDQKESDA